jgi:hypothetical protein
MIHEIRIKIDKRNKEIKRIWNIVLNFENPLRIKLKKT